MQTANLGVLGAESQSQRSMQLPNHRYLSSAHDLP